MNTHTPGPWTVGGHPRDNSGTDWREILAPSDFGPQYLGQALKENAKLMAAAPELLAALEATLIPLERLGDFIGNTDSGGASGLGAFDRCAIIGQVRDAIDKAKTEGRQGE